MAIVTQQLAAFDEGRCRMEIDYDDADLMVRTFRCINDSVYPVGHPLAGQTIPAYGEARRTNGTGPTYSQTFDTTFFEQTIPTSPANRLQLTVNANGRLDSVEYSFRWPA
jgi:hypothetical protein